MGLLASRLPLPAPCRLFTCGSLRRLSSSLYRLSLSCTGGALTPRPAEVVSCLAVQRVSGNECDCSDFYRAWEGFVSGAAARLIGGAPPPPPCECGREVTREPSRKGHFLPVNHVLRKEIYRPERRWSSSLAKRPAGQPDGVKIVWSS